MTLTGDLSGRPWYDVVIALSCLLLDLLIMFERLIVCGCIRAALQCTTVSVLGACSKAQPH